MPKPTDIEEALLQKLDTDADSLINGHKGDIGKMCEVLSGLTKLHITQLRAGGPNWEECRVFREEFTNGQKKSILDWRSTCAICVTVGGLIWKFWG